MIKCELYHDNFQNYKRYNIPKAQLVIADWWVYGIETPEPTEDDILYWSDVHEQHRLIIKPINPKTGELVGPKTRNQIIKWLKEPQNDGAEYKMWGNSLAIPCAYTVLAGIADELRKERMAHEQ